MKNPLFFLVSAILLVGCTTSPEKQKENIITVSILPQKYFVERIVGNHYRVNVMVPPNASVENYEPTPLQMEQASKSMLYFRNGFLDFENALMSKLYQNQIGFIDLSKEIQLIQGEHAHEGGTDPHLWVAPREVRIQAATILAAVSQADPAHKTEYEANYKQFVSEIDSLDAYIISSLKDVKRTAFLIFHPALTYYARDYGLNQVAIEWEGKNPSLSHISDVIALGKAESIKTVFIQRQFDEENAQMVAGEIGGKVVVINPLDPDWMNSMRDITDKLVHALKE